MYNSRGRRERIDSYDDNDDMSLLQPEVELFEGVDADDFVHQHHSFNGDCERKGFWDDLGALEEEQVQDEQSERLRRSQMDDDDEDDNDEYPQNFGIKIVNPESLLENDEECDDDVPDQSFNRNVFQAFDKSTIKSAIVETLKPKRKPPTCPPPVLTARDIFDRLNVEDSKPNILSRRLQAILPKPSSSAASMPRPPPLTRRPSVSQAKQLPTLQRRPIPQTSTTAGNSKDQQQMFTLHDLLRNSQRFLGGNKSSSGFMPRLQGKPIGQRTPQSSNTLPTLRRFNVPSDERLKALSSNSILNNNVPGYSLHSNTLTPQVGRPKKEVSRCDICNKSFATEEVMLEHRLRHTQMFSIQPEVPKKKKMVVFTCPVCSVGFPSQEVLQEHCQEHKTGDMHFQCRVCFRKFASLESLAAHTPIHDGAFRCRGCRRGFDDREALEEHELTHKTYDCGWCGKVFMNSGNLKAHERIHTGERPFKCKTCPKAFKQLGGLQYHLKANSSHEALMDESGYYIRR